MTDFILALLGAALVNNLILVLPLGTDALRQPRSRSLALAGGLLLALATPLAWALDRLLAPLGLGYLGIALFIPALLPLAWASLALLARVAPRLPATACCPCCWATARHWAPCCWPLPVISPAPSAWASAVVSALGRPAPVRRPVAARGGGRRARALPRPAGDARLRRADGRRPARLQRHGGGMNQAALVERIDACCRRPNAENAATPAASPTPKAWPGRVDQQVPARWQYHHHRPGRTAAGAGPAPGGARRSGAATAGVHPRGRVHRLHRASRPARWTPSSVPPSRCIR